MEEKIHKVLLFRIPLSICNFRCSYCYLSQRDEAYQGIQPQMKYTPEQVGYAIRKERLGGIAYCNLCADGETLLLKNIEKYVEEIVKQGHYVEIVTNLTITPVLKKILMIDKELLKKIEFKCSFHYIELKKKNLLQVFADNVNLIWQSGCSANIEITPHDELIPYIDEIKNFSIKKFGALPHFTIARNDKTKKIDYLTSISPDDYKKIWNQFDSDFFKFKTEIFGVKQHNFCYAGKWSAYIDLSTGEATQCYCGSNLGNVFENPDDKFPEKPIGKCPIAHCYNGHMLLTLGLIPEDKIQYSYGDIRDRKKEDGSHFLKPELKQFFNTKLEETNEQYNEEEKKKIIRENNRKRFVYLCKRVPSKIKSMINK